MKKNNQAIQFRDAVLAKVYSEWPEARPAVSAIMRRVNAKRRLKADEASIVRKALNKVDGYEKRMTYARHLCRLAGAIYMYEGVKVPEELLNAYNEACEIATDTWVATPALNADN